MSNCRIQRTAAPVRHFAMPQLVRGGLRNGVALQHSPEEGSGGSS